MNAALLKDLSLVAPLVAAAATSGARMTTPLLTGGRVGGNVPPPLAICLLGGFAVAVRGQPLRKLRTRQGQRLLALLALKQGRDLDRAALAAQLWGDSETDAGAMGSLRRALTDLRAALGPEATRLKSVSQFRVSLDLSQGAYLDTRAFDGALAAGTPAQIDQAIDLYAGPLMPDLDAISDPDGIIRSQRDARHFAFLDAIERRADRRHGAGDIDGALDDLRRLLAIEPTRESASRVLMTLLVREKQDRAGAMAEYHRLRRRLFSDLAPRPEISTRALYEAMKATAAKRSDTRGLARVVASESSAAPNLGATTFLSATLTERRDGGVDRNVGATQGGNSPMRTAAWLRGNDAQKSPNAESGTGYFAVFAFPSASTTASISLSRPLQGGRSAAVATAAEHALRSTSNG